MGPDTISGFNGWEYFFINSFGQWEDILREIDNSASVS